MRKKVLLPYNLYQNDVVINKKTKFRLREWLQMMQQKYKAYEATIKKGNELKIIFLQTNDKQEEKNCI